MSNKKDIWQQVSRSLEFKMSKGEFKTWFSRTSLRRFDPEVVVLGVPNKFVANWLNDNYLIDIKKSFKKIAKISRVSILSMTVAQRRESRVSLKNRRVT